MRCRLVCPSVVYQQESSFFSRSLFTSFFMKFDSSRQSSSNSYNKWKINKNFLFPTMSRQKSNTGCSSCDVNNDFITTMTFNNNIKSLPFEIPNRKLVYLMSNNKSLVPCYDNKKHHADSQKQFLRLSSFNVLAESNDSKFQSGNRVEHWRGFDSRLKYILREIDNIDADIYAFQEVDEACFKALKEHFRTHYSMIYSQKIDAKDGNVIAWKTDLFQVCEVVSLSLDVGNKFPETHSHNIKQRIRLEKASYLSGEHKKQTAAIVILKLTNNKTIAVVNTHLLFNRNRSDLKIKQLFNIADTLNRYAKDKNIHIDAKILMGDFNITPQSTIYKLLSGNINYDEDHSEFCSGQDALRNPRLFLHNNPNSSSSSFSHEDYIIMESKELLTPLSLSSKEVDNKEFLKENCISNSYSMFTPIDEDRIIGTTNKEKKQDHITAKLKSYFRTFSSATKISKTSSIGEMPWTSWAHHQKGCVDYMFYSSSDNFIEPYRCYDAPFDERMFTKGKGSKNFTIPNKSVYMASDHIPVVVDFRINYSNIGKESI